MKVKMYIDLSNDGTIQDEKLLFATSNPLSQKMHNLSRYLIEVDLPIHHFRVVEVRKVECVTLGKEEE